MATLSQARDGCKARLDTIAGLRGFDYVPGGVTAPAAVVYPETVTYSTSQGSQTWDATFVVLVLVSLANDRTAQDALDAYLTPSGATSIPAAFAASPTLGGLVDYAVITGVRDYGNILFGDTEFLGARLTIEVGMR